jgi:hypothetical protein
MLSVFTKDVLNLYAYNITFMKLIKFLKGKVPLKEIEDTDLKLVRKRLRIDKEQALQKNVQKSSGSK